MQDKTVFFVLFPVSLPFVFPLFFFSLLIIVVFIFITIFSLIAVMITVIACKAAVDRARAPNLFVGLFRRQRPKSQRHQSAPKPYFNGFPHLSG